MVKLKRVRWAGHVVQMGRRGMHIGYWWEGEETIRKPRCRWVDNIKMEI
jgi:hypothetical protein